MEEYAKVTEGKELVVRKKVARFIEKLFRYFKYDFRHDTYKEIVYSEVSYKTPLEERMKHYYDAYLYLLNHYQNPLSQGMLKRFFYLLFEKEDVEITEDDPKLTGIVTVDLKGPENLVKIDAQGMIFPILLEETIQGMMELFASHGNPKDDEIAEEVMKRCDYVKSEPWNMRLGAELWKKISNEFKSKGGMVPYWFKELASLGATTFAKVIPEILSQTKEGNLYAKKIYRMAIKQFDEDNFDSDMSKLSLNKTIINDNIF